MTDNTATSPAVHPVGVELRSLNNRIRRYMESHSTKREIDVITGTNGWIIAYIAENEGKEVFQRDLERDFGITRSTASKVVDLMVKKGLVERRTVERDARLRRLVLTEAAAAIAGKMRADAVMLEKQLCRGIDGAELKCFTETIEKMKRNLSAE